MVNFRKMDTQLSQLYSKGDMGSLLSMSLQDPRSSQLVELALDELYRRVPLPFRVLAAAAVCSNKKELFLGVLYAMIIRQRSQRMNSFQKMLTAACLCCHANNQVLKCLLH